MRNLCFRTALTVLRTTVLAGVQSQYTNNKLLFVKSVATNASCSYIFFVISIDQVAQLKGKLLLHILTPLEGSRET